MTKTVGLVIDTTAHDLGLGLFWEGGKRTVYQKPRPRRQSDLLFPTLTGLFKKARLTPADLGFIAVNNGPGSFTGVRVGVSAARAIAQGLSKPLVGVSGLEALARKAAERRRPGSHVAAVKPALRGEVYFALYQVRAGGRLGTLVRPRWDSLEAFLKMCRRQSNPPSIAGHPRHDVVLPLEAVFEAALERYRKKDGYPWPYERVHPVYLQPSWAERKNTRYDKDKQARF